MTTSGPDWQTCDRFLDMRSKWFTLIGEHLRDHKGQLLEYWRVERAHSVIILPIQTNQLLLMPPSYRPGVGESTLDFPGGRLPETAPPEQAAKVILSRELGVEAKGILELESLNPNGWHINSSFSNQKLYGFVAKLHPDWDIASHCLGPTFPVSPMGIRNLLGVLSCLQCRMILLEWWLGKEENPRAQQDSNL